VWNARYSRPKTPRHGVIKNLGWGGQGTRSNNMEETGESALLGVKFRASCHAVDKENAPVRQPGKSVLAKKRGSTNIERCEDR